MYMVSTSVVKHTFFTREAAVCSFQNAIKEDLLVDEPQLREDPVAYNDYFSAMVESEEVDYFFTGDFGEYSHEDCHITLEQLPKPHLFSLEVGQYKPLYTEFISEGVPCWYEISNGKFMQARIIGMRLRKESESDISSDEAFTIWRSEKIKSIRSVFTYVDAINTAINALVPTTYFGWSEAMIRDNVFDVFINYGAPDKSGFHPSLYDISHV